MIILIKSRWQHNKILWYFSNTQSSFRSWPYLLKYLWVTPYLHVVDKEVEAQKNWTFVSSMYHTEQYRILTGGWSLDLSQESRSSHLPLTFFKLLLKIRYYINYVTMSVSFLEGKVVKVIFVVQSLSCVWLFVTPWTVTCQVPCSWGFPDKNTGVSWDFLLQGIFPTQGSNLRLLHYQVDSLPLSHPGSL